VKYDPDILLCDLPFWYIFFTNVLVNTDGSEKARAWVACFVLIVWAAQAQD